MYLFSAVQNETGQKLKGHVVKCQHEDFHNPMTNGSVGLMVAAVFQVLKPKRTVQISKK